MHRIARQTTKINIILTIQPYAYTHTHTRARTYTHTAIDIVLVNMPKVVTISQFNNIYLALWVYGKTRKIVKLNHLCIIPPPPPTTTKAIQIIAKIHASFLTNQTINDLVIILVLILFSFHYIFYVYT